MAEDEEVEEVEEVAEKEAKYITATLNKTADADLISKYSRLTKIGNFQSRDVFEAGVAALAKSEQYQEALKAIKEELEE